MDFEEIDRVDATTLSKGDIVSVVNDYSEGKREEFLQVTGPVDDDNSGVLVYPAHNLSTGEDEDAFIVDEWDTVAIYRSY